MEVDTLISGCALALLLIAVSAVDIRHHIIPDALNGTLFAGGLILAFTREPPRVGEVIVVAIVLGGVLVGLRAAYRYFRQIEGLGLGDVKFLAAASTWVTWEALPMLLLVACGTGLAFAAATGHLRHENRLKRLAFGPHLSVGTFSVWLLQNAI